MDFLSDQVSQLSSETTDTDDLSPISETEEEESELSFNYEDSLPSDRTKRRRKCVIEGQTKKLYDFDYSISEGNELEDKNTGNIQKVVRVRGRRGRPPKLGPDGLPLRRSHILSTYQSQPADGNKYVFSSLLANLASKVVMEYRYKNIIEYHKALMFPENIITEDFVRSKMKELQQIKKAENAAVAAAEAAREEALNRAERERYAQAKISYQRAVRPSNIDGYGRGGYSFPQQNQNMQQAQGNMSFGNPSVNYSNIRPLSIGMPSTMPIMRNVQQPYNLQDVNYSKNMIRSSAESEIFQNMRSVAPTRTAGAIRMDNFRGDFSSLPNQLRQQTKDVNLYGVINNSVPPPSQVIPNVSIKNMPSTLVNNFPLKTATSPFMSSHNYINRTEKRSKENENNGNTDRRMDI